MFNKLRAKSANGKYDVLVIGGGSAAFAAAIKVNELEGKVGIIEKDLMGGTCVNRGCIPSKNLLHAAKEYFMRSQNGVSEKIASNLAAFDLAMKEKQNLVLTARKEKYENVLDFHKTIHYIQGEAQFVDAKKISVGNEILEAKKFIIATGSSPVKPPISGLENISVWTSKESLESHELPKHLIVVGGGAIGLEIGQLYNRFGSKVTVIEMMNDILPQEEPLVSRELRRILSKEGMIFYVKSKLVRIEKNGESAVALISTGKENLSVPVTHVLLATGVGPNTRKLGLEKVGVELSESGYIMTDKTGRTSNKNIYAAGDVVGPLMLVTTAAHQGSVAAEAAMGCRCKVKDPREIPYAVFTDPEVAGVGPTEEFLKKEHKKKVISKVLEFENVPKAMAVRNTDGLIKMTIEEKSGKILSVHVVGERAADMIHEAALAIQQKLTISDIINLIHVYPTHSECIKLVCQSFLSDVKGLSCCAV